VQVHKAFTDVVFKSREFRKQKLHEIGLKVAEDFFIAKIGYQNFVATERGVIHVFLKFSDCKPVFMQIFYSSGLREAMAHWLLCVCGEYLSSFVKLSVGPQYCQY
jgi:hypothetical protein